MKTVTIDFPDGDTVEIAAKGFRGKACEKTKASLFRSLGRAIKDEPTDDARLPETETRTTLIQR